VGSGLASKGRVQTSKGRELVRGSAARSEVASEERAQVMRFLDARQRGWRGAQASVTAYWISRLARASRSRSAGGRSSCTRTAARRRRASARARRRRTSADRGGSNVEQPVRLAGLRLSPVLEPSSYPPIGRIGPLPPKHARNSSLQATGSNALDGRTSSCIYTEGSLE